MHLLQHHTERLLHVLLDEVYHGWSKITFKHVNVGEREAQALHVENAFYRELPSRELWTVLADLDLSLAETFLINGLYQFQVVHDGVLKPEQLQ